MGFAGARPEDDIDDRVRESFSGGLFRSRPGKGFVGDCFEEAANFFSRSFDFSLSSFLLSGSVCFALDRSCMDTPGGFCDLSAGPGATK